jgi:hypothetical protein
VANDRPSTGIDYEAWPLVISASQVESFRLCARKWWFKSIHKLPEPAKEGQIVGQTMHSIIERYLLADDLGRDKSGAQVELYPTGWDSEITPLQSDVLKRLVKSGLENGMLERVAGRKLEEPFARVVIPNEVAIQGYIDCLSPLFVQDHKTTKKRRYVKKPDELKKDVQMLVYAAEAITRELEAGRLTAAQAPEAVVRLRHNTYVVDPDDLRAMKIDTEVLGSSVEKFWREELTADAKTMLALKQREIAAKDWRATPEPKSGSNACRAFGGCPYLNICAGRETPDAYLQRTDRMRSGPSTPPTGAQGIMADDIFAQMLAMGGAPAATAQAPAAAPAKVAAPTAQTVATPAQQTAAVVAASVAAVAGPRPPWAHASCNRCGGNGIMPSNGQLCFVCAALHLTGKGEKVAEVYEVTIVDGKAFFGLKGQGPTGFVQLETVAPKAEAKATIAPPTAPAASVPPPVEEKKKAPDPLLTPNVPAAVTPVQDEGDSEEAAAPTKKDKGGRPKRGLGLYFDVLAEKSPPGNVVLMSEFIQTKIAPELAAKRSIASFYSLPAYERRDIMAQCAAEIAAELGSADVFITSGNADALALGNVLVPFATRVMRAAK